MSTHTTIPDPRRRWALAALLLAGGILLALWMTVPVAHAEPVANKFVLSSQFGWDVNKTALETPGATQAEADLCTTASKDTCQPGQETDQTGGFSYAYGVAVNNDPSSPGHGDVYAVDNNHRVQVFTPAGAFVSVFGWDVNKTALETPGATQAEKNLCTAESKDTCQAGAKGDEPGQIDEGSSIAIDPASGNIYLAEAVSGEVAGQRAGDSRVQAFTAVGGWLFEIGQEVNATTKGNLCTQLEVTAGDRCKAPVLIPYGSTPSGEAGAFNLEGGKGDLLAVGGPEDLLYVGDEHRVQEFTTAGEWQREVSLASFSAEPEYKVQALAVDKTGGLYLTYAASSGENTGPVHELSPAGVQTGELEVAAVEAGAKISVRTLALDPYGRLAITGFESKNDVARGFIYSTGGAKISEFAPPSGSLPGFPNAVAFAASDEMYVANENTQDVEVYVPALFPEAVTCPASQVGATSAVLCGQLNANGLETHGFFVYGPPAGLRTPVAFEGDGGVFEAVSWQLTGLVPNQTYEYELGAEAQVNGEPVAGNGEQLAFHTTTPLPEVPGAPSATEVSGAFAVLGAQVNPEHAPTRYHFEYGPCAALAGCASVMDTGEQEASSYALIDTLLEASGLQPGTGYSFRLVADNQHEEPGHVVQGGTTVGAEGHFTTAAAPVPQAQTGGVSGVGTTSATVAGLVDPDGQAAVYAFELGVYRGAGTQFGVALSGLTGAGSGFSPVQLSLSGLQPGTTYAYRVTITSGYGQAIGATLTFTTEGLSAVLPVPSTLGMLAAPGIAFPGEAVGGGSAKSKKAKPAVRCKRHAGGRCVKTGRKPSRKPGRGKASRASRNGSSGHGS
jgi:hypothetical protein